MNEPSDTHGEQLSNQERKQQMNIIRALLVAFFLAIGAPLAGADGLVDPSMAEPTGGMVSPTPRNRTTART